MDEEGKPSAFQLESQLSPGLQVDVFACDAVLMPINLGNAHWVCACINVRQKRFEFYDSMGHSNATILKVSRLTIQCISLSTCAGTARLSAEGTPGQEEETA